MGTVVVVGSLNMDVVAEARRMPRPGETVAGTAVSLIPGGKGANQAVAAKRAGTSTLLVGNLGTDDFAEPLATFLETEGLVTSAIPRVAGPTGTAIVLVDEDGENSIVVVPGANGHVTGEVLQSVTLSAGDVVLLQNEIPAAANHDVINVARSNDATTVLNIAPFRPTPDDVLQSLDYVIANETEFACLVDEDSQSMSPRRVASLLADGVGAAPNVVVTLGADGLCARIDGSVVAIGGHGVTVRDTTGAGDCFAGAFGAALADGQTATDALHFANAAAALSVQRRGAGPGMPHRHEIRALLGQSGDPTAAG